MKLPTLDRIFTLAYYAIFSYNLLNDQYKKDNYRFRSVNWH